MTSSLYYHTRKVSEYAATIHRSVSPQKLRLGSSILDNLHTHIVQRTPVGAYQAKRDADYRVGGGTKASIRKSKVVLLPNRTAVGEVYSDLPKIVYVEYNTATHRGKSPYQILPVRGKLLRFWSRRDQKWVYRAWVYRHTGSAGAHMFRDGTRAARLKTEIRRVTADDMAAWSLWSNSQLRVVKWKKGGGIWRFR